MTLHPPLIDWARGMTERVDVYYDFRSPYAYFAAWRIHQRQFVPPVAVEWRWHPVSIDILLNLQAGRDPWAAYVDPLAPPKRRHLVTDVRRSAAFYGAPLAPPFVPRPDPAAALCAALVLDQSGIQYDAFLTAVFDEMWCRAGNIGARKCWQAALSGRLWASAFWSKRRRIRWKVRSLLKL